MSARARLRLQDYLPYRLSVASNAVSRLIARAYEQRFGLKIPQWRLIAVLADEGPLT
ncbi:MAG: MarR family transcriptional regulator, partial [Steroidobacteraceae bacterium]